MDYKDIHKRWDKATNTFSFQDQKMQRNNVLSIDTPPPTMSGTLHMGHIFSYCHSDFIARFNRIHGMDVFYPIGFDNNGLPTERLVEKRNNTRAISMVRAGKKDEFLQMYNDTINEDEGRFESLFKDIGYSFNWEHKYQTIDSNAQRVANISFIDLFTKGLVYLSNSPVYWDVSDQTSLAQAEIEEKEVKSEANNIVFTIQNNPSSHTEGSQLPVKIMTTRPELLPACLCLLYNPDDNRYNGKGVGQKFNIKLADEEEELFYGINLSNNVLAETPFELKVPVIPHKDVHIDKGTGLVMCCSFGDWQDVIWAKELNLEHRNIISDNGRIANKWYDITDTNKNKFDIESLEILNKDNSRTILEARKWVIEHLKSKTIKIDGEQIPYLTKSIEIKHIVKHGERSGKPLEIINKPQWYIDLGCSKGSERKKRCYFINTINKKDDSSYNPYLSESTFLSLHTRTEQNSINQFQSDLLKMTDNINIYPSNMKVKLTQWIEGLAHDWCISRNRFAGISIPSIGIFITENKDGIAILPIVNIDQEKETVYIPNSQKNTKLTNLMDLIKLECDIDQSKLEEEKSIQIKKYIAECIDSKQNHWIKKINNIILEKTKNNILHLLDLIQEGNKASLVLDTWFTSSLSPQINTKNIICNPEIGDFFNIKKEEVKQNNIIYPFTVRPQAHEIIRTWTFYTMAKAYLHAVEFNKEMGRWEIKEKYYQDNNIKEDEQEPIKSIMPWKNIVLSGWCLASDKTKMSKSKGNIVDPIKIIKLYGPDPVRYWASTAHLGIDTPYSESNIKEGVRLVKKLKNIIKFIDPYDEDKYLFNNNKYTYKDNLEIMDQSIIIKINKVIQSYIQYFKEYDYCRAREVIENFFWKDLCENYIEIIKGRIYGEGSFAYAELEKYSNKKCTQEEIEKAKVSAILSASVVIEASLVLLSPFLPFTTEEIYLQKTGNEDIANSIHSQGKLLKIADQIENMASGINKNTETEGDKAIDIIAEIRKYKASNSLSIKSPISYLKIPYMPDGCEFDIKSVCNAFGAEMIVDPNLQEMEIKH